MHYFLVTRTKLFVVREPVKYKFLNLFLHMMSLQRGQIKEFKWGKICLLVVGFPSSSHILNLSIVKYIIRKVLHYILI